MPLTSILGTAALARSALNPTGFERYDPDTGEELYAIMRRNLYGTPNAAINYVRTRDEFILKAFNMNGWTC